MLTQKVSIIDKEEISKLIFPVENALINELKQQEVKIKLDEACSYGNLAQHKVHITFKDQSTLKKVHTTIWEVKNNLVYLKHNITIPINRIVDVKF